MSFIHQQRLFTYGKEALSIGANTFQYFTRNPRGGKARAFDEADMKALDAFLKEHQFGNC